MNSTLAFVIAGCFLVFIMWLGLTNEIRELRDQNFSVLLRFKALATPIKLIGPGDIVGVRSVNSPDSDPYLGRFIVASSEWCVVEPIASHPGIPGANVLPYDRFIITLIEKKAPAVTQTPPTSKEGDGLDGEVRRAQESKAGQPDSGDRHEGN